MQKGGRLSIYDAEFFVFCSFGSFLCSVSLFPILNLFTAFIGGFIFAHVFSGDMFFDRMCS